MTLPAFEACGADRPSWSVTVVIPAFNAESSLPVTLDALMTLEPPSGGSYEIVVSDDGSTDATVEVASRYPDRVRVTRGERRGPAAARNRGAATATGDILAFVDAGDMPFDPWLHQIVATFEDPSVGIASWPAWINAASLKLEQLHEPGIDGSGLVALATCFALRRHIFDAIGGYDVILRYSENSDLCERAVMHCVTTGHRVANADHVAARVTLGRPLAYYDRPRLEAAEHLLRRDAKALASDSPRTVQLHAIAAVNAARCQEWSRARAHALSAMRCGRSPRDLARVIVTLIPPLARRLWTAEERRRRLGILRFDRGPSGDNEDALPGGPLGSSPIE